MNVQTMVAGIGLAAFALASPAAAQQRDYGINIVNDTGTTIEYFYF
jgi:hypothetical protein